MPSTIDHIAWFITPHGFGHAARAAAGMLALNASGRYHFEIFTRVPEWFFRESHLHNFTYHECGCDIGLAQRTSLDEDLPETLRKLSAFLPFDDRWIASLASELLALDCRLVVCDIAPLGIAVAEKANLPSVLVENFTWEWIYSGYLQSEPAFDKYIPILRDWNARAGLHIQTDPVCVPVAGLARTAPVSRPLRQSRAEIRDRLRLDPTEPAILVTMGGIETRFEMLQVLHRRQDLTFIIPGASQDIRREGPAILLPHHSGFYHPDLLAACDAVVGKLGYSTLAEAYNAGTPFGFIPRARFPESPPLADFVRQRMRGLEIPEADYISGAWIERMSELLALKSGQPPALNGAEQLAAHIGSFLKAG